MTRVQLLHRASRSVCCGILLQYGLWIKIALYTSADTWCALLSPLGQTRRWRIISVRVFSQIDFYELHTCNTFCLHYTK